MLKIKTKIGMSKIHGIGLFADQFIKKGTITWEFDPHFDMQIDEKTMNELSEINRDHFLFFCYFDKKLNKYILCSDYQKFINHTVEAKNQNILSTPDMDVAARDIEIGEELLCDYNKFDSDYFNRMKLHTSQLL